jgi:hypothetical protein
VRVILRAPALFPALLDVSSREVLVVFFAGVFHYFPFRLGRENSIVLPRFGKGFGILDRNLIRDVLGVG